MADLPEGAAAQIFIRQTLKFLATQHFLANKDPVGSVETAKRVRYAVANSILEKNPDRTFEQQYHSLMTDFWKDVAEEVREQMSEMISDAGDG